MKFVLAEKKKTLTRRKKIHIFVFNEFFFSISFITRKTELHKCLQFERPHNLFRRNVFLNFSTKKKKIQQQTQTLIF